MSKLFEIKNQLDSLLAMLEVDPETGEVGCDNPEMVFTQIDMLTQEKDEIIRYLCEVYKEKKFLEKTVDDKIDDLRKQKDRLKRKQESLLRVIDRECNGEKKDYGFATVNYRKASSTVIDDEDTCLKFVQKNGFNTCYKVKTETKLDKAELKKLMANEYVPGAHIETKLSCSVK